MLLERIEKIVKELTREKFTKGIVLFGSCARGKATPISDIDICVIDDDKFSKQTRMKAYGYASDKINISLFSDLPLYIKYEIFKGKPLFIKNKKFFRALREKVVLNYLEQKWLFDFHLRGKKWSID